MSIKISDLPAYWHPICSTDSPQQMQSAQCHLFSMVTDSYLFRKKGSLKHLYQQTSSGRLPLSRRWDPRCRHPCAIKNISTKYENYCGSIIKDLRFVKLVLKNLKALFGPHWDDFLDTRRRHWSSINIESASSTKMYLFNQAMSWLGILLNWGKVWLLGCKCQICWVLWFCCYS